ncbi:SAYSvFN domain-containing protein 1 [Latimeria chalumnae]|uniref:SAYSvFN domain-containing protein 1 n=1 Tax=Latimeria chalumnae TaxID=7897 RepID=UPI0003C1A786|nr:PREDICTED: SAYSvFN domain-containing protein 1 [Latimeria chalumnae]|eukprot:XP_006012344.1 PREDICTED: SAYSvFN domain-containing protein 1 [Latimeria chalumnae]
MEEKLAEFRAGRRRRAELEEPGARLGEIGAKSGILSALKEKVSRLLERPAVPVGADNVERRQETIGDGGNYSEGRPSWLKLDQSILTNITFLKFLLWLALLGFFVELEFGLAYFVLSMFYWIYVGTRGPGERRQGEKSAYSVFNPGCETIQGTLTAQQFEQELMYRPLAGR